MSVHGERLKLAPGLAQPHQPGAGRLRSGTCDVISNGLISFCLPRLRAVGSVGRSIRGEEEMIEIM